MIRSTMKCSDSRKRKAEPLTRSRDIFIMWYFPNERGEVNEHRISKEK